VAAAVIVLVGCAVGITLDRRSQSSRVHTLGTTGTESTISTTPTPIDAAAATRRLIAALKAQEGARFSPTAVDDALAARSALQARLAATERAQIEANCAGSPPRGRCNSTSTSAVAGPTATPSVEDTLTTDGHTAAGGSLRLTILVLGPRPTTNWSTDRAAVFLGATLLHAGQTDGYSVWQRITTPPFARNKVQGIEVHSASGVVAVQTELRPNTRPLMVDEAIRLAKLAWAGESHGVIAGRLELAGGPAGKVVGAPGTVTATPVHGGSTSTVSTDSTGQFTLSLPPGEYELTGRTRDGGAGRNTSPVQVQAGRITSTNVDVQID
jgi:hypothetical protein